jgi:uncharacterized protein (TIGR03435 family)
MRISTAVIIALLIVLSRGDLVRLHAQQMSVNTQQLRFAVISFKRSLPQAIGGGLKEQPDGGIVATSYPLRTLIARAYPPAIPADIEGLPTWALTERYDVSATSNVLNPTADERTAMLQAMLAERLNLVVEMKDSEQAVFDLVVVDASRRLGPSIKPSDVDCAGLAAKNARAGLSTALPAFLNRNESAPPCSMKADGPRLEGDVTMSRLASLLRPLAGRRIIDKTGLPGSYRLVLEYDGTPLTAARADTPSVFGPPSVFVALRDQLGLALVPSRAVVRTIVVQRVERPSVN